MAVPPAYSDLGKAAKDLVNKGYNYGGISVGKVVFTIRWFP